ncbi:MAG: hypothetical protein KDH09_10275 [Chrysiogenetes bacterium]|nr:hypothetical protein [Chrysiogenetes bacterium]
MTKNTQTLFPSPNGRGKSASALGRGALCLLILIMCLGACTITQITQGAPLVRGALTLEPEVATLQDALDLLGPPDGFCGESVFYESALSDRLDELEPVLPAPPGSHPVPGGLCMIWVADFARDAQVDFGRPIQIAMRVLGGAGYAPLMFGTDIEQVYFIRVHVSEDGIVESVHARLPPLERGGVEVNPF